MFHERHVPSNRRKTTELGSHMNLKQLNIFRYFESLGNEGSVFANLSLRHVRGEAQMDSHLQWGPPWGMPPRVLQPN